MDETSDPSEPRWLDSEEQDAWRSYIEATIRVWRALDSDLHAATGLTDDDYGVLSLLSESPSRARRMTDLATFLDTSPSRVTYRIDRLIDKGYLRREPCPTDRRGTLAVLTEDGLAALEAAAPIHVANVRRHLTDHLTREDFLELGRILETVASAHRPINWNDQQSDPAS
ncbi:MAG: MarR family winged helix-turn-helix transcriptional regulator [Microthrixaceae bacterium]